MAFLLEDLVAVRPYGFHVCSEVNFASIRSSGVLRSAHALLSGTVYEKYLQGRRRDRISVKIGDQEIELRDHRPLAPGSLALPAGYTLEAFIAKLNARVFLWAGTASKPVRSGLHHIARYASEGKVYLLRVPVSALIRANPDVDLEVTFCNSGSARHHGGQPAFRSPETFMPLAKASRRPAEVVELTFMDKVILPEETVYSEMLEGPWLGW